jgi:glyoxylase-like metal-dependent hydrolase (beta-lactamase superfamily II)
MATVEQPAGSDRFRWSEPGVYPMGDGIFRIPLPLHEDSLHAVNCYVVLDTDGAVLIDPGQALSDSWSALVTALEAIELKVSDVSQVLVTHIHRDHYTQAVALRREHPARISLGAGERRSLELAASPIDRLRSQLVLLKSSGATDVAEAVRGSDDQVPRDLWEEPDDWMEDWTKLPVAKRSLTAIPTPGHTRGHLVFRDDEAGVLFAGDHILPHITPSIGFEPDLAPLPLADYLQSLLLVRGYEDTRLLPAHGPETDSVHARIDELLDHHAHRLESTYLSLSLDVETARQVADALVWTRHSRHLDELSPYNKMLAVLETKAHLDVLADRGRLQSHIDGDGVERYFKT